MQYLPAHSTKPLITPASIILFCLVPLLGCNNHNQETTDKTATPLTHFMIQHILPNYFIIQYQLSDDQLEGITNAANEITKTATMQHLLIKKNSILFQNIIKSLSPITTDSTPEQSAHPLTLKIARSGFKDLSKVLAPWATDAWLPKVDLVWCSMSNAGWIQPSGPIRNPYHGKSMLACGEKVKRQ